MDNFRAARDWYWLECLRETENARQTRARTGGDGAGTPGKSAPTPQPETRYGNARAIDGTLPDNELAGLLSRNCSRPRCVGGVFRPANGDRVPQLQSTAAG